jgi:beta-glucosidase
MSTYCEEVFPNFPKDFKIGSASSAYQVEGAYKEDDKSLSIWDIYTHKHPEKISDYSNGDVSANSYHFYMKDVEALKFVGVS